MKKKIVRVLIGKCGLDGHSRGAKVVAGALRDAGFEVIYTGIRQVPENIVNTAVQEDVDCIGISVLSGAHMTIFRDILGNMRERNCMDIMLFGGGIVPERDIKELEKIGVKRIFTPGTYTKEIVSFLRDWNDSKNGDQ